MKRHLIMLGMLVLLFACKHGEPTAPAETSHKLNLRAATCSDTTDDGKFEAFNDDERKSLLANYAVDNGLEDTSYVTGISISGRAMSRSHPTPLYLSYHTKKPHWFDLKVFFDSTAAAGPGGYDSALGNHPKYLSTMLAGGVNSTGCYRLYYVIGTPSTALFEKPDAVVTKGHFDIDITP